jgi:UTP:GlnB (protein PII) uridylyltransferase
MPNRRLTADELIQANALLDLVREKLQTIAEGDRELLFAYRRKIAKELGYDERSKPMVRRALKRRMRALQLGLCPICKQALPETYCVLDRFNAVDGYIETNVRLLCQTCDHQVQKDRRYA